MVQDTGGLISRQLEVLWTTGTLTGLSDAQLLSRFTAVKDAAAETAFRELVNRHGPMVMGVCRQILRRGQDAEDAFQATFLILVRKAQTVQVRESLAPWLYSVAYRTAHRARAAGSRYRQGEAGQMEALGAAPEDFSRLDLRPLLHEELGRLPNKYRAPIVLCHLEGKTHEEAARMLQWPVGTVSGRLSRGRQLLKSRLERRGLSVPSAIFTASGWNIVEPIPLAMVESTLTAASRFASAQSISSSVLSLTQGVLRAMLLQKLKIASLALLVVGGVSGGALVWARGSFQSPQQPSPAEKPTETIGTIAPLAGGFQPGQIPGFTETLHRLKNTPNMADLSDPIAVFGTGSILVVESPDGRALEAKCVDGDDKRWRKLAIPVGLRVTPIAADDTLALAYEGKSIDLVSAFSARTGEWSTIQLAEPAQEAITPVIGRGCALYQSGNSFYAFSAQKGAWDILHLPVAANGAEKPRASISESHIKVQQGDRLYVFGFKGGWSEGVTMKPRPAQKAPSPRNAPQNP